LNIGRGEKLRCRMKSQCENIALSLCASTSKDPLYNFIALFLSSFARYFIALFLSSFFFINCHGKLSFSMTSGPKNFFIPDRTHTPHSRPTHTPHSRPLYTCLLNRSDRFKINHGYVRVEIRRQGRRCANPAVRAAIPLDHFLLPTNKHSRCVMLFQ
jgi:hypothetical protein